MILGSLLYTIMVYFSDVNIFASMIAFTSSLIAASLLLIYGEGDFKKIRLVGKYEVGFKEFVTSKHSNEVSVYYPISKQLYNETIGTRNTEWARHGDDTILGIARAGGNNAYGSNGGHLPLFIFRAIRGV